MGALIENFHDLTSRPAFLLDGGTAGWLNDFDGPPRDLADLLTGLSEDGQTLTEHWRTALDDADTVTEADVRSLFSGQRAAQAGDNFLARRELADLSRSVDYAAFDAGEELLEMLDAAQQSVAGLRGQTNLADTALQQAALSGQITDTEINVALAQLMAYNVIREGLERQTQEIERRRYLQEWVDGERAFDNRLAGLQAATRSRRAMYRNAMLLPERHGQ